MTQALTLNAHRFAIDEADIAQKFCASLDQNGFAVLENVFDAAQTTRIRRCLQDLEMRLGENDPEARSMNGHVWAIWNLFELMPELMPLVANAPLLGLVAKALDEESELCRATLMKKVPGVEQSVAWHQDKAISVDRQIEDEWFRRNRAGVPYTTGRERLLKKMLNVRINVDPHSGGCVKVIPGSHQLGSLTQEEAEAIVPNSEQVSCPAPEGSVTCFHPLCLHSSESNSDDTDSEDHQRRVIHLEMRTRSIEPHAPFNWHRWNHFFRFNCEGKVSFQS